MKKPSKENKKGKFPSNFVREHSVQTQAEQAASDIAVDQREQLFDSESDTDSVLRSNAIKHDELPKKYAEIFNRAQLRLHKALSDHYSPIKIKISPKQITELNVANDCSVNKLRCIIQDLLETKKKSWGETVRIINGENVRTELPALFGVQDGVPHLNYINRKLAWHYYSLSI